MVMDIDRPTGTLARVLNDYRRALHHVERTARSLHTALHSSDKCRVAHLVRLLPEHEAALDRARAMLHEQKSLAITRSNTGIMRKWGALCP